VSPVEVHATAEGPADAPVLVFSNSLGATLEMWDPQAAALQDRFRVVRYDIRGHGRSPVGPGPITLADLASDVVALLDRLGVARAHFCGLSLGGMTGMYLATHHPDRIDRLVLCCTSAYLPPPEGWLERAATVRAEGTGAVAPTVVGRWFTPQFATDHPAVVDAMLRMIASTPPEGYAVCCEAIASMDQRGDLSRIQAPTLVVAGEEDPATPPDHARVITGAIPGARLELLSPAAHLANVEQPQAVTRLLVEHLDGTAAG
jgi:3-oxoadipate enol-lactonase